MLGRRRFLFFLASLLLASTPAAAQPRLLEKGPELGRLEVLAGEWEGRLTRFLPGGKTLELAPRLEVGWDVGGVWLRGRDVTELAGGTRIENLTWITWHPRDEVYVGAWQDNVFPGMVGFRGRWLDDRRLELDSGEIEIGGRPHRVIFTYTFVADGEYTTEMRQSWDGAEPAKVAEGRFVRSGSQPAPSS